MNLFENLQKIQEEFYDGFKHNDNYYEIFKNPTSKEIDDIKNVEFNFQSIRGIIIDNTVFAWTGKIIHDDMKNRIDVMNNFRFAFNCHDGWEFNIYHKTDLLEICKEINNYKNILSKFDSLNAFITIFYNKKDVYYFDCIEELQDYIYEREE